MWETNLVVQPQGRRELHGDYSDGQAESEITWEMLALRTENIINDKKDTTSIMLKHEGKTQGKEI